MNYYDYRAVNRVTLKEKKGVITADDIETAKMYLKNMYYDIRYINDMRDCLGIRKGLYNIRHYVNRASIKNFLEQLSFMLDTDISLHEALVFMRDNSEENCLRYMSRPIAEDVRKGMALSDALANTGFFDEIIIYRLKAAEEGGNVSEVLSEIADNLEKNMNFKSKVRGAMIYPSVIFVVFNIVMIVLMTIIVPMLTEVIVSMGGELPLITKLIIKMSDCIKQILPIGIIITIITVILYNVLRRKSRAFCIKADELKLKVPIIKNFIMLSSMNIFCSTVATLQKSNITLGRSLYMAHKSMSNTFIQEAVKSTSKSVEGFGVDFGQALQNERVFPDMMVQMVLVGNKTGKIIEILNRLSKRYETELDSQLKMVTKLIEPIMIVVLGIVVGFVVVGIYMAMFSVATIA